MDWKIKYARKEPAADPILKKYAPEAKRYDVQVYNDPEATKPYGRFSWDQHPPKKNQKSVVLNGYRWELKWLPDLVEGMTKAKEFLILVEGEKILPYEDALKAAKKAGSKAEGLPLLAQYLSILTKVHRGINPKLAYAGALKKGLSVKEVRKMTPVEIGDLMFV